MIKKLSILLGVLVFLSSGSVFAKCCKYCKKAESAKNILIVVTSSTGSDQTHKTGVWLEEYAVPYQHFISEGYKVTVASPLGGESPIDSASTQNGISPEWKQAVKALKTTEKLNSVNYKKYQAIVLPGGHGPLYDLAIDENLAHILAFFNTKHRIIAAVCHGPAGLVNAKTKDGKSILAGHKVTGFSNKEEVIVGKDKTVPFALETKLKELGADYSSKEPWSSYVVVDRNIITGQNPQSSEAFANAIIKALKK